MSEDIKSIIDDAFEAADETIDMVAETTNSIYESVIDSIYKKLRKQRMSIPATIQGFQGPLALAPNYQSFVKSMNETLTADIQSQISDKNWSFEFAGSYIDSLIEQINFPDLWY